MNKSVKTVAGILRIAVAAVAILLQLLLIIVLLNYLYTWSLAIYVGIQVLAIIQILVLVSRDRNSSYTIAWILVISLLPVFGYVLFLLWGRTDTQGKRNERTRESINAGLSFLQRDPEVYKNLSDAHPWRKRICSYLERKGYPVYENTECRYYPIGEAQFDAIIADLESAEKFIFMQYFILSEGVLWNRIREVLIKKAAKGVEIRLMYDDFGSITTAPDSALKELKALGIQVVRFSPVHKFASRLYINYRNHQKICVIDGNIAHTGGTNIADEYINAYEKHGHWKDTGIRLEGDAAYSLTVTFLSMWDVEVGATSDYEAYKPKKRCEAQGFFQPFADGPANNPDNPAEEMYRSIIAGAQDYVYITTPYLVINNSMIDTLCTAAESGVDVRIITPKIWDHWYVHAVTRSNYKPLLQSGVRIYEYTPGYIHAKTILSDDEHAVTGSINMDYRSFHLHFENGVWICGAPVLADIKADIESTLELCEEIELEQYLKRPWYIRALEGLLRIFAVLL